MKRSDVIKELIFYYQTDEFDSDHDARINANRVLRLLENLGMLPPTIPTNKSGWEIGQGLKGFINAWEKEDESED